MEMFKDNVLAYFDLIDMIILTFKDIITKLLTFDLPDQTIDAVEAVGVSLTGLFIAMEAISLISSMRLEGRIEDALQIMIKLVVAKIIIENSHYILGGIYELFNGLGLSSIEDGFKTLRNAISTTAINDSFVDANKGFLGIGWILMSIAMLIVTIVVTVMMFLVTIQIVGIIFEVAVHQAVGPIALSTLCNGTMRSTGLSFIKSYSAVCLQVTVIGAIFKVFGLVYNYFLIDTKNGSLATSIKNTGALGSMFVFISPILMIIILGVSISKSGELTKRMFGA